MVATPSPPGAPRVFSSTATHDSSGTDEAKSVQETATFARQGSGSYHSTDGSNSSDGDTLFDGPPPECPHSPLLVEKLLEVHGDDMLQAHAGLHPVVRAAREENFCSALVVGDLTRNASLNSHFQKYNLRDFFNHRGQRRYQNLSMSFAAKQHPDIKSTFGSSAATKAVTMGFSSIKNSPHLSARAYRLATEMVRRDREAIQQRNLENYRNLETKDKIQLEDVQKRQHEMLFLEVANYDQYLPNGVTVEELLPLEMSRIQQNEEKKRFEKLNSALIETTMKAKAQNNGQYYDRRPFSRSVVAADDNFLDNEVPAPAEMFDFMKQHWNLRCDDISDIVNNISSWTLAAGMSASMGFDRSVFCRFLIDVGVVDQDVVPYVWAVQTFDQYARHVRVCNVVENDLMGGGDHYSEAKTVVAPIVCKLDFVTVMDVILRRRYSKGMLPEFMGVLKRIGSQMNADWLRKEQEANAAAAERQKGLPPMEPSLFEKVFSGAVCAMGPPPPKNQQAAVANNMMFGEEAANADHTSSRNCASESAVWKRNRLISGMLAEPEVLQLVEQYRSVFEELFNCYTFKEDTSETKASANSPAVEMEFVDFVQFCQDFRMVPRLASMYDVLRAFRNAECLDYPEERKSQPPSEPGTPTKAQPSPAVASDGSQEPLSARRRHQPSLTSGNLQSMPQRSPRPSVLVGSHQSIRKGNTQDFALGAAPRRAGHGSAGGSLTHSRAETPEEQTGGKRSSRGYRKPSVSVHRHGQHGPRSSMERSPPPEDKRSLSPPAPPKPNGPYFGVAAFVETLCRIALTYLIVHGNSVQVATSSRAKIVWLMAYLQTVLEHLRESHGRRLNGERSSSQERRASKEPAPATPVCEPLAPSGRGSKAGRHSRGNSKEVASDATPLCVPAISRRLERTLERVSLKTFKAHAIMELQLDRHMPSVAAPPEKVEEKKAAKEDPPPQKESARVRRRKSRYKIEGAVSAVLDEEGKSSDSAATSRTQSKLNSEAPDTPQSKAKEEGRAVSKSLQLSGWATRQLQNRAASAMSKVQRANSRPARSRTKDLDESSASSPLKVGKDVGRKSRTARGAALTVLDSDREPKDEGEEKKVQREVFAVKQEPPSLQDDSFKFGDLLFKRLLRPHSPGRQERERALKAAQDATKGFGRPSTTNSATSTATGRDTGAMSRVTEATGFGSSGIMTPLQAETGIMTPLSGETAERPASHISQIAAESPVAEEPILTKLSEDRHNLQKGLGGCVGKLERCLLTPPPLNAYATQLNERLERMMSGAA